MERGSAPSQNPPGHSPLHQTWSRLVAILLGGPRQALVRISPGKPHPDELGAPLFTIDPCLRGEWTCRTDGMGGQNVRNAHSEPPLSAPLPALPLLLHMHHLRRCKNARYLASASSCPTISAQPALLPAQHSVSKSCPSCCTAISRRC